MTPIQITGRVAAAALLLAAWPAKGQDFSAERLSQGVRTISTDAFAGRYPGEVGEGMILGWLIAQYEALGLEPGGPDGEWLQPVDLARYEPARPATAAWRAGGDVHGLEDGVLLRAASNDGRAQVSGAPVVFAGYGIHAPERNWDDYGDMDVEGAVVVIVPGEPEGELFNGEYRTAWASDSAKAAEAYRRGAVGVLMLMDVVEGDPAWTRRAQFNDRRRTLSPGNDDLEFTGAVLAGTFADWTRAAGLRAEDATAGLDAGDFRAVALEGVTLDVDAEETVETQRSWNLLARIPGTERPEETLVFSAHWDHVGVRGDGEGDHIYNGAWDNASGTVGLVEMARALKAAGPFERSIVFLHVTAEEQGLLGAFWYAANPVYPLETTVADINIDMLPLSAPTRDLPIFGLGQNSLEDELQTLAEAEGRYVTDDGQPEQGFYYRSDHFAFARAGVPALMPWHGVDLDEGGREVGLPAYQARFRSDYHQPSDEWSEDLDFSSAVENLTLLYRLVVDLADSDRWPSWKPTSEFGAVRDRSAASRE